MTLQIIAPHFCAGVTVSPAGVVVDAAPIVRYMRGWTVAKLRDYAEGKRWSVAVVVEAVGP